MSNPYVFITDRKITLINDIMPVLEKWCNRAVNC